MNLNLTLLRNILLSSCLLICGFVHGQAAWQSLGPDDNNQPFLGGVSLTAVATHPITGEAYLASTKAGLPYNEGEGFVRKFNSTTNLWEDVGATFSEGALNGLNILFDSTGTLYVGYTDATNDHKVTVKKFNIDANLWETVGSAGFSSGFASGLTLTISTNDVLFVSYGDGSLDRKATVKKFDGTGWVTVGAAGFTDRSTISIDLAIAGDDTLYVSFTSWYGNSMKATVMKFDGTSWQITGIEAFSDGGTDSIQIVVNPVDNVPYVAYYDFLNGYSAKVRKFNGTDWEYIGAAGFSEGSVDNMAFTISAEGIPFVAYSDHSPYSLDGKATLMAFTGIAWETIGNSGFSIGNVFSTGITLAGNTPYVCFIDEPNGFKPTLMKFDGANWVCLGGTIGFSEEATFSPSSSVKSTDLIITDDGVPYMGYFEESNNSSIAVKKYNFDLNSWESVGDSPSTGSYYLSMASHQNTPYIAFTESSYPHKATVMKYNNTAWEIVGQAGFTSGSAAYHAIVIAPDSTPYIIYKDGTNYEKATVKKFNGTAWESVGNEGFSTGTVHSPTILVTTDGIPYIAYSESTGFGSTNVVMKFNGVDWEIVGEEFTDGTAKDINLAMGPDGFLYVAFVDDSFDGKAIVKKFNGSTWESISQDGLPNLVYNLSFAIKPDGQFYLSFKELENMRRTSVMRYNGIKWVYVGSQGIEAGNSYLPDMVVTPDGQYVIVTYSSPCTYAKTYDITCHTTAPIAVDQVFCNSGKIGDLIAEGENIRWYNIEYFGTPFAADTPLFSGIYYVAQMQNDCEGSRTVVNIIVDTTTPPVAVSQSLCYGATVSDLVADGENLIWYADDEGGESLASGALLASGTYYVSQTQNDCESLREAVDIVVNTTIPPVALSQSFCYEATASDLVAEGENLIWYANEEGDEPLVPQALLLTGTYYVSQTQNDCESLREAVDVVVNSTIPPVATAQSLCNGATVSELVAEGENLAWYVNEEEGEILASETLLVTGTYYVSQTQNDCESLREAVDVVVKTTELPEAESPQIVAIDIAVNAFLEDLTVNGVELLWYDAEGNLLLENTQLVSGTTYYVTQTIDDCESEKLSITVEVVLGGTKFNSAEFFCYPNPVVDKLHIVSDSNITHVDIYTLHGQKVMTTKLNAMNGELDMASLANSTYLVVVFGEDGTKSFTILKAF